MEEYKGTKFKTLYIQREIPYHPGISQLKKWGKKFSELGFVPQYVDGSKSGKKGSAGNLSFRNHDEYIITASYSDLGNLLDEDFVAVLKVDIEKRIVWAKGIKEPSSEAMLHWLIYQKREDIGAIFHAHAKVFLDYYYLLDLCSTKQYAPYGSIDLAKEVCGVLDKKDFIIMKNHGFLSLGKTIDQAGKRALELYEKLQSVLDKKE
jgi:ribulose-5-phosphate 4-epimerase/fuculose-1-phosphate aldolase